MQFLLNQRDENDPNEDEENQPQEDPRNNIVPSDIEKKQSLLNHSLHEEIMNNTGCSPMTPNLSIPQILMQREHKHRGIRSKGNKLMRDSTLNPLSNRVKEHVTQRFIPGSKCESLGTYDDAVFCSIFNSEGSMFMTACKDSTIRLYDTVTWKETKLINAKDVGWSIISTDFSPDGNWLIYSSWSDFVHIANAKGNKETHEALNFVPNSYRFCLFSIQFSPDSREIIGGSSDDRLYIYDLDRKQRTHRILAHKADVNAVAFCDKSSQILFTGSDDWLVKVWDRRILSESKQAVGVFRGHTQGITFIDSKQDGRYLISNGKDHKIKLWDLRNLRENISETRTNDNSIMTYSKHKILQTLIRCRFSPESTTGQRYIYTGSYAGTVYVYDILTGDVVAELNEHRGTVRDLHWHPNKPLIMTSSWDNTVNMWSCGSDIKKDKKKKKRENTRRQEEMNDN